MLKYKIIFYVSSKCGMMVWDARNVILWTVVSIIAQSYMQNYEDLITMGTPLGLRIRSSWGHVHVCVCKYRLSEASKDVCIDPQDWDIFST